MKNLKPAFTLAELLLCIGIIGVVSAMGMTIAKHGADRAYNLFYYNGYINLYNAIADAKAVNPDANNIEIMNHVSEVLSREDDNLAEAGNRLMLANSNVIQSFMTYKAGTAPIYLAYGLDYEQFTEKPETLKPGGPIGNPEKPDWVERDPDDNNGWIHETLDPNAGNSDVDKEDDDLGKVDNEGNGGGKDGVANGWVTPDDANAIKIETNNGSNFYYPSNIEGEGLNGVAGGAGVSNAIPITMTIPQRKTRTNNGVAIVRFAYVDADNGYLIPIADGSTVNLQLRRDLLPAYIDNGIVGRNNVINRNNFEYRKIVYSNYRDAFCTVRNGVGIGNLINCDGYSAVPPREGILKFADPRNAR